MQGDMAKGWERIDKCSSANLSPTSCTQTLSANQWHPLSPLSCPTQKCSLSHVTIRPHPHPLMAPSFASLRTQSLQCSLSYVTCRRAQDKCRRGLRKAGSRVPATGRLGSDARQGEQLSGPGDEVPPPGVWHCAS